MTASLRDLLISDFPPPETVAGLWQYVPSPDVPINLNALEAELQIQLTMRFEVTRE